MTVENKSENDSTMRLQELSGMGERIVLDAVFYSVPDYINFLKHRFAYQKACDYFKGKTVLDLGCGSGYGTTILAQGCKRVVGLDINHEMIAELNQKNGKANLAYQHFDGEGLPFPDDEFDAVVSLQVIEHVPDVPLYLSEILRVLKPGADCMLTTPNRRIRLLPFQRPWNPYHLREYRFEELQSMLQERFSKVKGFSLQAGQLLTDIDLNRTRQRASQVYFLWPFKNCLKQIFPFLKRHKTEGASRVALTQVELDRFPIEQFEYVNQNIAQALDLMFIVTK